jgi:hypothetical protein
MASSDGLGQPTGLRVWAGSPGARPASDPSRPVGVDGSLLDRGFKALSSLSSWVRPLT